MSLREKVAAIVGALGLEPKMSSGGRGGAEILNGYGRDFNTYGVGALPERQRPR